MFAATYPEFSVVAPKAGFDLALQVNVDAITPANAGALRSVPPLLRAMASRSQVILTQLLWFHAASFIDRIAALKRNILSAPFEQCFEALTQGTSTALTPVQIPFRRNETMYVLPQADRIVIVYSVCFDDKTDQAIARVFLQVRTPFATVLAVVIAARTGADCDTGYCRSSWTRAAR